MTDPNLLGRLDLAVVLLAGALLLDIAVELYRIARRPPPDDTIATHRRPWKDPTP